MKHRYVKAKDAVYWIEKEYNPKVREFVPTIKEGYYLASYETPLGIKHLISDGNITSCFVRHINDGKMYDSYVEASKALQKLEEEE